MWWSRLPTLATFSFYAPQAFHAAVDEAVALAEKNKLVTFGIKPTSPETGYGYIQANGNDVRRFVEKPDLETAQAYLSAGDYFWNSGMFCFKAGTLLEQMQLHSENILENVRACIDVSRRAHGKGYEQLELDAETFTDVPENSIDYAVFEKSDQIAVVPCDIGWSDIGSWAAMGELTPGDEDGNRVDGQAKLFDTKNCYIRSKNRLVGTVGVEDLIVIDTADAVLVASGDRAQDVKQVYAELKRENHDAYKLHKTVYRPWGSYSVLEEGEHFKIKRIEVKPHSSLSLQMHHHRSEHWVVLKGEAQVVNGEQSMTIKRDESTFIPAGHKHRLCNATDNPLVIIEVQTGKYVGEDDIVRFEDNYGRCQ